MKLFSDKSTCAKCGADSAKLGVEWCPGSGSYATLKRPKAPMCDRIYNLGRADFHEAGNEHMHMSCPRCEFLWLERPLDSAAPLEQLATAATE